MASGEMCMKWLYCELLKPGESVTVMAYQSIKLKAEIV